MEILVFLGILLLGALWNIFIAVLDDSWNKTDRGKGKLTSDKYVTR